MNHLIKLLAIDRPPSLPAQPLTGATVQTVLHFVFGLAGIIALLMISIAAFRYVISRGDAEAVKKSKNTILYAIVGLVISMFSYGIVTFVFNRVTT